MELTLTDVRKRIKEIRDMGEADPEVSHPLEDGLALDVIAACADEHADAFAMARLTRRLLKEDRQRWYG